MNTDILREYENLKDKKQMYLDDLMTILVNTNATLEGNCFYYHESLSIFPDLYSKQVNLFWCGKQSKTHICEIGFNAGHSTMLMLLGNENPTLTFTVFDIGHHLYTKPCFDYVQSKFSNVNFEFVEGDSTITMPDWIQKNPELLGKYDVVHIDGGHSEYCISNDMKNSDLLVKINGIIIIDDTNQEHINNYANLYISSGNYTEINVLPTTGYPHRILRKIK